MPLPKTIKMKTLSELIYAYEHCDAVESYLHRETPWDDISFAHNEASRKLLKEAILELKPDCWLRSL